MLLLNFLEFSTLQPLMFSDWLKGRFFWEEWIILKPYDCSILGATIMFLVATISILVGFGKVFFGILVE